MKIYIQLFDDQRNTWTIQGACIISHLKSHGDRLYTIRCLRYATGHVDTVSEFQQYTILAQAKAAMKFIAGR